MGPKIRPPLDPAKCSIDEIVEHAWKTPMDEFTHTYEVNVTGVYYSVLALLKLLDAGNKGNNRFREGVSLTREPFLGRGCPGGCKNFAPRWGRSTRKLSG